MKAICAWCNADMGDREPLNDQRETHGICLSCFKKQRKEIKLIFAKIKGKDSDAKENYSLGKI